MGNFEAPSTNQEQNLFLRGLKKAIWIRQSELPQDDTLLRMDFPYITAKTYILFFQNEVIKEMFIQKGGLNPYHKLEINECVLGEFLGFPPKAIKNHKKGLKEKEKAVICYYGLTFLTKKKHVWDDLSYLLFYMPIPKEAQTHVYVEIRSEKFLQHGDEIGRDEKWEQVAYFSAGERITKEKIRL